MAWDDTDNLWWMKRQDSSKSMLPAIGLGIQMRQNQQEMALRLKQQALQQQSRLDLLAFRNKQMDQEIAEYDLRKKDFENEQEDMRNLSKWMPEIQAGVNVPMQFKTYKGQQAYQNMLNGISLAKSRERETAAQIKASQNFNEKMAALWEDAPIVATKIRNMLDQEGTITPEMIAEVDATFNSVSLPKRMAAPGSMRTSTARVPLPGGGWVTWETPESKFRLGQNKEDFIRDYIKTAKGSPEGSLKEIDELRKEAEQVWGSPGGSATPKDRVRVISPEGKSGTIPRSQLDQAQRMGYKLAP